MHERNAWGEQSKPQQEEFVNYPHLVQTKMSDLFCLAFINFAVVFRDLFAQLISNTKALTPRIK